MFLKILQTLQENACVGVFFMKLQTFSLQVFKKQTPTQVLSCEVCKTLKNTYFEEYLQTAASESVPFIKKPFLKTLQYSQDESNQW